MAVSFAVVTRYLRESFPMESAGTRSVVSRRAPEGLQRVLYGV